MVGTVRVTLRPGTRTISSVVMLPALGRSLFHCRACLFKIREQPLPVPFVLVVVKLGRPERRPGVVVGRGPSIEELAVDGCAAADSLRGGERELVSQSDGKRVPSFGRAAHLPDGDPADAPAEPRVRARRDPPARNLGWVPGRLVDLGRVDEVAKLDDQDGPCGGGRSAFRPARRHGGRGEALAVGEGLGEPVGHRQARGPSAEDDKVVRLAQLLPCGKVWPCAESASAAAPSTARLIILSLLAFFLFLFFSPQRFMLF